MSHIQYPTIDLFIYNLTRGLGENEAEIISLYQKYWLELPEKLKQSQTKVRTNATDPNRLDFENKSQAVDGSYSRANFDDTDCLRVSCSIDVRVEPSNLKFILSKLKDLAIIPQLKNLESLPEEKYLAPGKLSESGYLGQTWMISGWIDSDTNTTPDALAHQAYEALISKKHQYQQKGEFLSTTVFEMWCAIERWERIEKDSHVIFILYPDEETFATAATYYNAWRYLLYSRHKITWAYEQGRDLKIRLLKEFNKSISKVSHLSERNLKQLKADLQTNVCTLTQYVLDINYIEIQQHTIEVNLYNYQKQCEEFFKDDNFLKEFSNTVTRKYKVQLEKDHVSLRPGVSILENQTATIRGTVEIEQAERDRTFQTIVGVAGVGIGTGSIVASTVSPFVEGITQQPFKANDKLLPSDAAWLNVLVAFGISIGMGVLFGMMTWVVILAFRRSRPQPLTK